MFTGIVEEIGKVEALGQGGGGYQLRVRARKITEDVKLGDSIAVNGVCLTVTAFDVNGFAVGLSPETLRRTNLEGMKPGDRVNLERALRPSDRLGGHFVQGHVDGVGTIAERRREGDSILMRFRVPEEISQFIVEKGFIAVDGVSLTVTGCGADWFSVALIAFTQGVVALAEKGAGDAVNLEVDIVGKYVQSFLARQGVQRGITAEFLAEEGFL